MKSHPALPLGLCSLALLIGCQRAESPDSGNFGRFEGNVVASWNDDGRHMTLREDFVYVDPQDRRWKAPTGSVVDGASIPSAFWSFIGGPFEGRYRNASVVHDVGCVEMTATWEDVHRMFYEACRCGGVDERMAKILYYAVYHFGPRWQPVTETRIEVLPDANGQMVEQEVTEQRMVRIDPPPPTLEEVEQVEALIAEENPEPSAIERIDRQALRRRPQRDPSRSTPDSGSARSSRAGEGVDRTARRRPGTREPDSENDPGATDDADIQAQTAPGTERVRRETVPGDRGGRRGPRPAEPQDVPPLPDVTPEEREWAIEQVGRYIEQQTGQQRPAEYDVERTEHGYRVVVQYRHLDEDGQPTDDVLGTSIVHLCGEGQVLEMTTGM